MYKNCDKLIEDLITREADSQQKWEDVFNLDQPDRDDDMEEVKTLEDDDQLVDEELQFHSSIGRSKGKSLTNYF